MSTTADRQFIFFKIGERYFGSIALIHAASRTCKEIGKDPDPYVMLRYGALNRESTESATLQRRDQNRSSRAWPISTVLLSFMAATVLFLLWDEDGAGTSDMQTVVSTQSNELQAKKHAKHSTHRKAKKTYSLVSSDVPIYGDYVEDMPDRPKYFPAFSTLVKGSVKIDCSDTVAWGRLHG